MMILIIGAGLVGLFLGGLTVYLIQTQKHVPILPPSANYLWQSFISNVDETIIILDLKGTITSINKPMAGFPIERVVGHPIFQFVPLEDHSRLKLAFERVHKTGFPESFEVPGINPLGISSWYSYRVLPAHGETSLDGFILISMDITSRRQAEEEVGRIFTLSLDGICVSTMDGEFRRLNPAFEQILGYSIEELMQTNFLDLVHPHDRENVVLDLEKLAFGAPSVSFETRCRCQDGSYKWLAWSARPLVEEGLFFAVARNVTERKLAEADRDRLIAVVEQSVESIVITSTEGIIQYVNPAFEKITGYQSEEVIGQTPRILRSGRHDDDFYSNMWETLLRGDVWTGHFVNRKKNGDLYHAEQIISPIFNEKREIVSFVALSRDVTRELELEKQLRQAQKMEAIGQLAGGIAHDFNNMLQVVLSYVGLVQKKVSVKSKEYDDLQRVLETAYRAAGLTRQLLTFSRQAEMSMGPLDMTPFLKEMVKILERTFPASIHIRLKISPDLPLIIADPTQINQVFLNLCINAKDAMESGGDLLITCQSEQLEDNLIHPDARQGHYLVLKVADTGIGIPKEHLGRIYEPFFTTKSHGKGTGLGLATTYGIVRQHGGFITCDSEVGKGTVFTIYFPAKTDLRQVEKLSEPNDIPMGRRELILVVDDQKLVLDVTRRTLENLSYRVLTAESGEEGVFLYKQESRNVALVLLDVQMPGMDGIECYENLIQIMPDVKVLLTSGFFDSQMRIRISESGATAFLQKPYTERELATLIRKMIDNESSANPARMPVP